MTTTAQALQPLALDAKWYFPTLRLGWLVCWREANVGGREADSFPSVATMLIHAWSRAGDPGHLGMEEHSTPAKVLMITMHSRPVIVSCSTLRRASMVATAPGITPHASSFNKVAGGTL